MAPVRRPVPWTPAEDQFLREHATLPAEAVAQQLGRSPAAIRSRRTALFYRLGGPPHEAAADPRTCRDCGQAIAATGARQRCPACSLVHSRAYTRARYAAQRQRRA